MSKKENEDTRGNAIVVDTNILINDPEATVNLQEKEVNDVFIARGVLHELDGLKNLPDIGYDVREALKFIEEEGMRPDSKLQITSKMRWNNTGLGDKSKVDNQLIAIASALYEENKKSKKYKAIKILSNDRTVRIIARDVFAGKKDVLVEEYQKDQRDVITHSLPQEIEVEKKDIDGDGIIHDFSFDETIKENQGIIISYGNGRKKLQFPAIRKGDTIEVIDFNIKVCGTGQKIMNGNGTNWSQLFAMKQLLDPEIDLVFLLGGAGTGKTFLALASAIEQKARYQKILVTRPMVHLEDEDNMGFLPGDIKEKMSPWLMPIHQNIKEIKQIKGNDFIDKLFLDGKIEVLSLDYIRGTTFTKSFLIVDEAQNLTAHQVKTIITRAGEGSKIVLTGDLDQIDRKRRINSKSSGLNYAANAFMGESLAGITTFKDTVRSRLVACALEVL